MAVLRVPEAVGESKPGQPFRNGGRSKEDGIIAQASGLFAGDECFSDDLFFFERRV